MLGFFGLAFGACAPDAPHSNPVDPKSPSYNPDGVLSGQVLPLGAPYIGIPNALVVILQDSAAQLTAPDGSFLFQNAPVGNITVVISKQSYATDTMQVTLQAHKSLDTVAHLDALPQVSGAQVVTSKIDQWYYGPVYSALVTAAINDPDGIGDINPDSVYVHIDTLAVQMAYSITDKNWQATIPESIVPNGDIQWLIGRAFQVTAADRENNIGSSQPFYTTRIIEAEPGPIYPVYPDTTTPYPQLSWNSPFPSVSFDYSYIIQVFLNTSGAATQVGNSIALSSNAIAYNLTDSLPDGQYFWTIAIIDSFGNSSTSREAAFTVVH